MSEAQTLGKTGEEAAAAFLRAGGYTILFRNWKWGKNEIDIIAEKDDVIAFVEVKTRSENPLDDPRNTITGDKRRAIIFAADGYIRRYNSDKEARFDLIIITGKGDQQKVEHIEGAFYPTLH
jgi:putative endonuclease